MTVEELIKTFQLAQTVDAMGVKWLEGLVPPDLCVDGNFRPVTPDHVQKLLPLIAAQGQQVAALGHFTNEQIVIEQGRHRRAVAEKLRRLFLVRIALNATPELIRTMRASVEESNEKLDDITSVIAVYDTVRSEGVSAAVAAAMHQIRPEVVSKIGYIVSLAADDPFLKLVLDRKLKTDWIAILKAAPTEKRFEYAQQLIAGDLTAKDLKALLATKKNGAPTILTYSRSSNGTQISAKYRDKSHLIAELQAAIEELEAGK